MVDAIVFLDFMEQNVQTNAHKDSTDMTAA